MKRVVYRFDSFTALRDALGTEPVLGLPGGPGAGEIGEGEWVLASFELAEGGRASASAARGARRDGETVLVFERRDWDRLRGFSAAPPRMQTIPDEEPLSDRTCEVAVAGPVITHGVTAPDAELELAPPSLLAPDTIRPAAGPPTEALPQHGRGAHVLLVDDDPETQEIVGAMLEAVGLRVTGTTTAEQALERIQEGGIDLVLLDWVLPGMNGLELCRILRHDPATATMPVIFLSGYGAGGDVVDAFASGADDFVAKPFRAPELGARIFALLRRARMSAAAG